jgi:zinc transporter
MTDNEPVLSAYEFDGNGRGNPLQANSRAEAVRSDKTVTWIHLDAAHVECRDWLHQNVSYLDQLILDALLAEETRPRVIENEQGLLIILRGVNLNENEEPEDMISIRLWIDQHRIISVRRRKLKAVVDIKNRLEHGNGPKDSAEFLVMLTTRLFQRMEPVLIELDQRTDDIEEKILDNPDADCRYEIVDIRKKAIMLRRYIAPQKDVISYLRICEMAWLDKLHRRQLQENLDRLARYVEDLDAIRERAQIVKDELSNALADRMNKNMYLLSIVAAVFLPLSFVTGLLGINVGGIPGVNNNAAFWIVSVVCAGFIILLTVVFRWLKWF